MRVPKRKTRHARYTEAFQRLLSVAPFDEWPSDMRKLFAGPHTLERNERLRLAVFLFGNGARGEDVCILLDHRLRDDAAHHDVHRTVADMQTPGGRRKFFYFDVRLRDTVYLDHTPTDGPCRGRRALARMLNAWDAYAARHSTTLEMQRRFFGQRTVHDPRLLFALVA